MQNIHHPKRFLSHFFSFLRPRGLFKVLSVNSLQGVTQGIGVLFIVPLLQLINPSEQASNKIAQVISEAFASLSLPLNIYSIVVVYILLVSFTVVLSQYQTVLTSSIIQNYTSHLRTQLFEKISNTRWDFIQGKKRSFFVHSLTQDISRVSMTTFNLLKLISTVLIILFNVVVAFLIDPLFTLTTIVFAGVLAFISRPLLAKAKSMGFRARGFHQRIYNSVIEMLYGLKNVKSHNLEKEQQAGFREVSDGMVRHVVDFSKSQAYTKGLHNITSVIVLGLYFLISIKIFQIPTASLLVLIVIFSRLIPRFSGFISSWQNVLNALPAFEGLESLMKEADKHKENDSQKDIQAIELKQKIELERVYYQYENAFSIQNISLQIPAGYMVAFAGNSGSGKTTLADLITGLLRPQQGTIRIDDNPLKDIVLGWRNSLSYVTQEPYFFHDSIRNNLMFGINRDVDEQELWQVLDDCAIADFIRKQEKGLDTIIGDQGTQVSGGERQRLAIARAILRKPALLILDEATSALDYANENIIYKLINRLRGKITIIVIAHRLSTIQSVDKIFVLDNGKLVETGTWKQLQTRSKGYLKSLMEEGAIN